MTMPSSQWKRGLATVMADMRVAVDALEQALDQERQALDEADVSALDTASADKAVRLQALERLDAERGRWMRAAGIDADADAESVLSTFEPWSPLLAALASCRRKNQINGGIVAQRLAHVRGALALLTGTAAPEPLYGASGDTVVSLDSSVHSRV